MEVNVNCGWLIVTFRALVETCLATFTSTKKKNCISWHDVPSCCCGNTPLLAKHSHREIFILRILIEPGRIYDRFDLLYCSEVLRTTHTLNVFQHLVATVGFHPSFTYFTIIHDYSRPELEKLVWLFFEFFSPKPR